MAPRRHGWYTEETDAGRKAIRLARATHSGASSMYRLGFYHKGR